MDAGLTLEAQITHSGNLGLSTKLSKNSDYLFHYITKNTKHYVTIIIIIIIIIN